MSVTLVNARIYVSRVIGGSASQEVLDMANEAILRGYLDWQAQKYWRFLLKDTSAVTIVAIGTIATGATSVTAPSTGAFDFVNVGQTVLVTTAGSPAATLPASTTVASLVRGTDGVVTSIVLSAPFTVTAGPAVGVSVSFSADIPIISGTNEYNLPLDYNAAATLRFTVSSKRTLVWRSQEYWDRLQPDETLRGLPAEFTTYNPVSEASQNFGVQRLKFDRIPDATDTARLRYFRSFNLTGTNIDMTDEILYKFLDYCRSLLLETKRAADDPSGYRESVMDSMKQAEINDEDRNSEDDADSCIKSQYEMGYSQRPLWNNGDFDATR